MHIPVHEQDLANYSRFSMYDECNILVKVVQIGEYFLMIIVEMFFFVLDTVESITLLREKRMKRGIKFIMLNTLSLMYIAF